MFYQAVQINDGHRLTCIDLMAAGGLRLCRILHAVVMRRFSVAGYKTIVVILSHVITFVSVSNHTIYIR